MSELDARPILASLANPTSREMFARVVLGTVGTSSRRGEERALAQLESAGLISAQGDAWAVNETHLRALLQQGARQRPKDGPERFLTPEGEIDRYPTRPEERVEFLRFLVPGVISADETVTEPELNQRLESLTADVARLRRAFVDHGILNRDAAGTQYRLAAG